MSKIKCNTVKTTCPYCGVGCGVLATPKPDGSVDIKGDPDHPANFGRLCSKGAALGETIDLEGRLLAPEINGVKADWDSALDVVANRFSETIRDHGPDSVAFYVSGQILTEDYYVANKLMKGFIGSANIDTNSRLCMASSVAGHRKAFGTDTVPGTYEDLELADLIVLVGSNLAWCHPVLYQRIEAAKEARPDMKIVLIDPRRTMTANIADIHLPISPDGDAALFCGLLKHISQHGVIDADYIENYTNGFQSALESAAALSQEELLQQTGLTSLELEAFYNLFSTTDKVVTIYSQGVNQSVSGTDKVSAIINCHLATGRIGKPGMGPFSVTGQPNAMGGREVGGLANMLACHLDLENADHVQAVQTFWNAPLMPKVQGLKAVDMFEGVANGTIKAIWIMSTNPVDSLPEADKVRSALEDCPFVVVSDVLSETDTIELAHVKLPAAAWGEKSGTVTNSERRISRQRQFLNWPGQAKPDWWQLSEVAKRMGFGEAFNYETEIDIFREYASLSLVARDFDRDFDIGVCTEISDKSYEDMPPFQWPARSDLNPEEKRFFANGNFYTPDRKARFIPVIPKLNAVATLDLPFALNTGRIRDHWHTMTRTARTPRLSSHIAEPYCEINPMDALAFDIHSADILVVSNKHGKILVRALISDRVKQGEVFVPMHWTDQYASQARVDSIIPAKVDPFSGQPASKNAAVSVSKASMSIYAFLVMREKPNLHKSGADYWALAKCEHGWRAELGFMAEASAISFAETFSLKAPNIEKLAYDDDFRKLKRYADFKDNRLFSAVYLADEPVSLSREWLVQQLARDEIPHQTRARILAGRADAQMPDKGAIVCSCHGIGANQIISAIHNGNTTVEAIGEATTAGTNCGSCRAEINGMINVCLRETKIAAE